MTPGCGQKDFMRCKSNKTGDTSLVYCILTIMDGVNMCRIGREKIASIKSWIFSIEYVDNTRR